MNDIVLLKIAFLDYVHNGERNYRDILVVRFVRGGFFFWSHFLVCSRNQVICLIKSAVRELVH